MVADFDPLIFELSAFIRAIRGNAFSVAAVTSCKILGPVHQWLLNRLSLR